MIATNLWKVLFLAHLTYKVHGLATPYNHPPEISNPEVDVDVDANNFERSLVPRVNDQAFKSFLRDVAGGNPFGIQRFQHSRGPKSNYPLTTWSMHIELNDPAQTFWRDILQDESGFVVIAHIYQQEVTRQYKDMAKSWQKSNAKGLEPPREPSKVFLVAVDGHLWGFSSIVGGGRSQKTAGGKTVRRYTYYDALPNDDPTKRIFNYAANGFELPLRKTTHTNEWSCSELHAMRTLSGEYGSMENALARAQTSPPIGYVIAPKRFDGVSGGSEAACSGNADVGCQTGITFVQYTATNFYMAGTSTIAVDEQDFVRIRVLLGLGANAVPTFMKHTQSNRVFSKNAQGDDPLVPGTDTELPNVVAPKRRDIEAREQPIDFAPACGKGETMQVYYEPEKKLVQWNGKEMLSTLTKPKFSKLKKETKITLALLEKFWKEKTAVKKVKVKDNKD